MGATISRWEGSVFTGDKNVVGSLELDGHLRIDSNLGSEKVTNGTFTGAATGWTLGGAWAYNANAVDKNADGTTTLAQDVSAVANEIYEVTYTVSGWSVGTVTVAVGGVSGTARGANGTYTEYLTATGTGNLIFTPTNTARFTIDTVSVKRVGTAAADRIVMWEADRLASGVKQAADGGLFLRSEDGTLLFLGDKLGPVVDDGLALGSAAESFSDLFLASGGVINFANGDVTLTHLANILSIAGGSVLLDATAAYGRAGAVFELNANDANYGMASLQRWRSGSEAPTLDFCKSSSSTIGTHAIVQNNDWLGFLEFRGSDGAAFLTGARIYAAVDGTPGSNDMPTRLIFGTTPDGAAGDSERLRIDKNGWQYLTMHDNTATPVAATAALKVFAHNKSVADDGIITLPAVTTCGFGVVMCDTDVSERTQFWVDSTGTVTLINNAGSVVANADTDTNLCIGTAATQEPLQVKNRLGATKVVNIIFWYD